MFWTLVLTYVPISTPMVINESIMEAIKPADEADAPAAELMILRLILTFFFQKLIIR